MRALWLICALSVLAAAAVSPSLHMAAQQSDPQIYASEIPIDATLLKLDRQALDEAYHQQLLKLFGVWLSQGAGDPTAITTGLKNARRAYSLAAQQIARRELQLMQQQLLEMQRQDTEEKRDRRSP